MIFAGTNPYRFAYTDVMKKHLEAFEEVKQVKKKVLSFITSKVSNNRYQTFGHFYLTNGCQLFITKNGMIREHKNHRTFSYLTGIIKEIYLSSLAQMVVQVAPAKELLMIRMFCTTTSFSGFPEFARQVLISIHF